MFNRISKWLEEHRGLLAVIAMILAIYLRWAESINSKISNALNVSLNWLTNFLKTPLTISYLLIFATVYFLIKYLWKTLRLREITIINARYYTPKNGIEITERIRALLTISREFTFPLITKPRVSIQIQEH